MGKSVKRLLAAGIAALLGTGLLVPSAPTRAGAATGSPGPLVRTGLGVAIPAGRDLGEAPGATSVHVKVVLAPSDPAAVARLVSSLYDPASPRFHQWLAPGQFEAEFAPTTATVAEATSWLHSRGLTAHRVSTFVLDVGAPAANVNRALGVDFRRFADAGGSTGLVAVGRPLVPSGLESRIAGITGLSTLPAFHPTYRAARVAARPAARPAAAAARAAQAAQAAPTVHAAAVGPACPAATAAAQSSPQQPTYTLDQLSGFYGLSSLRADGMTGAGQSVAVFELAQFSATDVASYKSCFGLTNPVYRVSVDGGGQPDPGGGTPEADLDIEQVATQAPDATIYSYESTNNISNAYDVWAAIVHQDRAKVISSSWAVCEVDAAGAGELSGRGDLGPLFQQAAAQGQTVLAASGDSGSEGCAPDAPADYSSDLVVDYPASDPNVTGVGGTDYYQSSGTETPWNDCYGDPDPSVCAANFGYQAAGGGGESVIEPRPSWQPVAAGAPSCSSGCREVPDLSVNAGNPMVTYADGSWTPGVGTSFTAPFMAGLVATRNQGCAAPTGNLAPTLYALARGAGSGYAFSRPTASGNGRDPAVPDTDMLGANGGLYPVFNGYNMATGLGVPIASGLSCAEVDTVSPSSGPLGTTVTITGLGLENARIYFGSVPVTPKHLTSTSATVVAPNGLAGTVSVHAVYASGGNGGTQAATFTFPKAASCRTSAGPALAGAAAIASVRIEGCNGYFVVDRAGRVSAFGAATTHGDLAGRALSSPIIGIEATADGEGYWLLGADGGVFTFGDARFFGSTGNLRLKAPVVGMAVTDDSRGYWIVARDGGVFTFGAARFFGSTGNLKLAAPVDGIAVAPGGQGYWLVASDGGVFTFTSDGFYGSLGGKHLAKPIVGMSGTTDGGGYTLVGADGGVFTFGDAPYYGSLGAHPPSTPVVDLSPAPANNGYYLVTSSGSVYAFGPGAHFFGSV